MLFNRIVLFEPRGGFLGISVAFIGNLLFPYGLVFAAGAILLPETHARGNNREATIGYCI